METAELAIIGAGPGGYAAAFYASDIGIDVTLIDLEPNPGGVCLYRGCIPSKALLHLARLIHETRDAKEWGLDFGEPKIDLDKVRGWKDSVIEKLTGGLGQLVKQRKIRYIQGRAGFKDPRTLQIEAGGAISELRFKNVIIAAGSRPIIPPMFDIHSDRILNSRSALDLPEIPKSMLVVGGGYIGLELGSVYAALGTAVSVVEMTGGLLTGVDRDLVRPLAQRLEKTMRKIMLNTRVTAAEPVKDGICVTFEGDAAQPREQTFDYVLVAVGRKPNFSGLGLEQINVVTDQRGFIQVDAQRRTADARIYAVGDLTGQPMLAHKASHEGRVAVDNIAGRKASFEPRAIPAVVFTDPEIAWCGLTEDEAKTAGRQVNIARFPWAASGRATTLGRTDGMTKLIIEPETERVLGVGIAGPGAGELIAEGVLAVEMSANVRDLAMCIHPHPTLSETVMESAESFFGHSTHIHRPKK